MDEKLNRKKKRRMIIFCVLTAFIIMISSFFAVDFIKIKRYRLPPIFCIPVYRYDNGSVDYYGLGYKIWKDYDQFDNETKYFVTLWILPKFWHI